MDHNRTLVKAARLFDPQSGKTVSPAAVLVEDGKIKEVSALSKTPVANDAEIIDLGNATLLPGLVDAHTHLFIDAVVPTEDDMKSRYNAFFTNSLLLTITMSPTERVLLGARLAREALESGFTSVRNLGHSGIDCDVALRNAINKGHIQGPRIQASARKIASPYSYIQYLNPALANSIVEQDLLTLDSREKSRAAVRTNLFYQASVIKIAIDEGMIQEEVNMIVEESHGHQLKVAAHAGDEKSIQIAINAGVDSVEHGNNATEEQLKQMKDKGIFLVITPTFWNGFITQVFEHTIVMSPAMKAKEAMLNERDDKWSKEFIAKILRSGVRYAVGSDMGWHYPGKTRGEAAATIFAHLRDAGMPSIEILRAVTTYAAELLGWKDHAGMIEPGKYADLIAVRGDPITDITELERVQFVMKDGQVIKNSLSDNSQREEEHHAPLLQR